MRERRSNNPQSLPIRSSSGIGGNTPKISFGIASSWVIGIVIWTCITFYLGIFVGLSVLPGGNDGNDGKGCSGDCTNTCIDAAVNGVGELGAKMKDILDVKLEKALETKCSSKENAGQSSKSSLKGAGSQATSSRFPQSVSHFAAGLARVGRHELFQTYDFGVPVDPNAHQQDVLMLYDSAKSLPSDATHALAAVRNGEIPRLNVDEATSNCDAMNVIFHKNPGIRQCVAFVGGQYQGYLIQRWMRVEDEKINNSVPLRLVGRLTKSNGFDELLLPKKHNLDLHQEMLMTYFQNLPDIQKELKSILDKIAIKNTVVVMTSNKGQSELLMNFVCNAQSRGFDISNALVFPTDLETKELAEGMGLATFYNDKIMHSIPKEEAARYGDGTFGRIMLAKVICVTLVVELGFDMLFQDVDVVWYKDPLPYFHSSQTQFDVYFQDDGNRQERYAPYSANSGFYFIRSNKRSQLLFRSMMYAGDLILSCRSHQQVLISLLSETSSLAGLSVKTLSRDDGEFPGGWHYHLQKPWMKSWIKGEKDPYVFHMCWTLNKVNKLEYMRQMGMWYVKDECVAKTLNEISPGGVEAKGLTDLCCSAEPLVSCFYSDKPSIIPCKDSPVKDKGQQSFW